MSVTNKDYMAINIEDIYPLTDFKQHSGKYQKLLRTKNSPVVLTVNGTAAFVIQDALAYQQTVMHLEKVEAELRQLKEQLFREAVMVGVREIELGQVSSLTNDEIFQVALAAEDSD